MMKTLKDLKHWRLMDKRILEDLYKYKTEKEAKKETIGRLTQQAAINAIVWDAKDMEPINSLELKQLAIKWYNHLMKNSDYLCSTSTGLHNDNVKAFIIDFFNLTKEDINTQNQNKENKND